MPGADCHTYIYIYIIDVRRSAANIPVQWSKALSTSLPSFISIVVKRQTWQILVGPVHLSFKMKFYYSNATAWLLPRYVCSIFKDTKRTLPAKVKHVSCRNNNWNAGLSVRNRLRFGSTHTKIETMLYPISGRLQSIIVKLWRRVIGFVFNIFFNLKCT